MKKNKVITNFSRYSEAKLVGMTTNIIERMTKNPDFPNPTPSIQTINKTLKEFNDLLEKCVEGTRQDTALKNEKKEELCLELSNLGSYINITANGELDKLDGTGFPLAKQPEAIGILPAPEYIHINDSDHSGEFYIEIDHVAKADGYLVLYSEVPVPEDENDWEHKIFPNTKGIIDGLKSVAKYAVKAAAMSKEANERNYYHYSPIVERVTQ